MPDICKPKRGSRCHSPRKRARSAKGQVKAWAKREGTPKILGFAGYKAGMTHIMVVDPRQNSVTAGQEIQIPVTILETPPMKIVGVRLYEEVPDGLRTYKEVWANKLDKELSRRMPIAPGEGDKALDGVDVSRIDEVRVIAHTQPKLVTGVPKKKPEVLELSIGGGTMAERVQFAKDLIGKPFKVTDFCEPGKIIDIIAVTTGKGWEGAIKRWGVKLLSHKNSKHRRQPGTMGPWHPSHTMNTVPLAGQRGYHQRTELNKHILKIGENGSEINPSGGFLHYGLIRNEYVVIHGSIPGEVKRLITLRDAVRPHGQPMKWEISYISTESKQGR